MTQANLGLVEATSMDKTKALYAAFGESTGLAMDEAIEPEAELFALAEQVDCQSFGFKPPSSDGKRL